MNYYKGIGAQKNFTHATGAFERSCNGSNQMGCTYLSISYRDGIGAKKDPNKTLELDIKSCKLGFVLSCSWVGHKYEKSIIISKDMIRAKKFYRMACDGGVDDWCEALLRLEKKGFSFD